MLCSGCAGFLDKPWQDSTLQSAGSFSLVIDRGNGRTILPETPSLEDCAAYMLVFTSTTDGKTFTVLLDNKEERSDTITLAFTPTVDDPAEPSINLVYKDLSGPIELKVGTYNLEVTAFLDAEREMPALTGRLDSVKIAAGEEVTHSVTLQALINEGTGTFSWKIKFPSGLSLANMTIKPLPPATGTAEKTFYFEGTEDKGFCELPAGYYSVIFILEKPGTQRIEYVETLHIYKNLESLFEFEFKEEHFNNTLYKVTFNSNGGSAVSTQLVSHGKKADEPVSDPTRTGYTFAGWYKEEAFTNVWDFNTGIVTGNVTLYAKWIPVGTYFTVTFNSNEGSAVPPQTVIPGGTVTSPSAPTRTGYTFAGWFSDSSFEYRWNFDTYTVNSDITLYARWTLAVVRYTVTFNSNGGSAVNSQQVDSGQRAYEPTPPVKGKGADPGDTTRGGLVFGGWYRDNNTFTQVWNFGNTVTGDLTLYAKWITVEMVRVEAGTFMMGSSVSEPGRQSDETEHEVTVDGFFIGKYQVTEELYEAVMDGRYGKGRLPAGSVSWYSAVEFCNLLSDLQGLQRYYTVTDGPDPNNHSNVSEFYDQKWLVTPNTAANGYRLPTEAQWEYAAKEGPITGTNTAQYYRYSGSNTAGDVAWYNENTAWKKDVGTKAPNRLGIYDMSGNVYEWCWDWYGGYPAGAQTNPTGPASGSQRVVRGGSFNVAQQYVRSASRDKLVASVQHVNYGFRIVSGAWYDAGEEKWVGLD
jgi:uncharacterized repeat protein (TIGR02543 family)